MRKRGVQLACLLFVFSWFLPVSIGHGGLADPDNEQSGLITLFYSVLGIPLAFGNSSFLRIALGGVCNLALLFSPLSLRFGKPPITILRGILVAAALFVCLVGYWGPQIRMLWGFNIWRLAFVVGAIAIILPAPRVQATVRVKRRLNE